jgi:hypothetical protein
VEWLLRDREKFAGDLCGRRSGFRAGGTGGGFLWRGPRSGALGDEDGGTVKRCCCPAVAFAGGRCAGQLRPGVGKGFAGSVLIGAEARCNRATVLLSGSADDPVLPSWSGNVAGNPMHLLHRRDRDLGPPVALDVGGDSFRREEGMFPLMVVLPAG